MDRLRFQTTEVDPHVEWIHGDDDSHTLIVDVSGFSKDQLKVQVEPSGSLVISGERIGILDGGGGGRVLCHFLRRFDLATDAVRDAAAIRVQLDRGVLHVQVPRRLLPRSAQQHAPAPDQYEEVEPLRRRRQEGEEEDIWSSVVGADTHTAAAWRQLAVRSMSKHRHVVLNVVLAVVLLWLVAFGESKTTRGGQIKNE